MCVGHRFCSQPANLVSGKAGMPGQERQAGGTRGAARGLKPEGDSVLTKAIHFRGEGANY